MATKLRIQLQDKILDDQYAVAKKNKSSRIWWTVLSVLPQRVQNDSLLRNSIFIMASTVVTSAVGYLYWVLAAHIYSAYNIGLASAFISAMSLTSTFASLGIGSALIQLLPRRTAGYEWSVTLNACIIVGIVTSTVGGILVAFILPLLSLQFATGRYHLLYLACFVVGVILSTVTTLLDQTFVAERATGNMAARNAIFAVLKLPLMLVLIQIGALGIFASWVLSLGATFLLGLLVLIPRLKRGYRAYTRGVAKQIRPMLPAFAGHHFINIGGSLPMYLLPVLVAMELSATDNAYYYTTWMLGSIFFMVSTSVATALFSEGSYTTNDLLKKVRASAVIICALLCPILLILFFGGRTILSIFGERYAEHGLSLLMVLMVGAVPDGITNIYVSFLRVQGRLRSAALLNVGMAILALVLAWILLPKVGVSGAGWAWLIAQSCGSLVVGLDVLVLQRASLSIFKQSQNSIFTERLPLVPHVRDEQVFIGEEENNENLAATWLVDTIKQLAVPLSLQGQYYGTSNVRKVTPPKRPICAPHTNFITHSSENGPVLKRVHLKKDTLI